MASFLPVAPHREAEPDSRLGVAGRHGSVKNGADVVVIPLQPPEPATLIVAGEKRCKTFTEGDERRGVATLDVVALAARGQLLRCEFTDRVQHPEPRLAIDLLGPYQTLVGEGHQPIEHVQPGELGRRSAYGLRAIELATSDEHRQPGKENPLTLPEQLVAPGDGTAQRLLPLRQIA